MGLMTSGEIRAKILRALRETDGNRTHAAKRLGITRQHLYYLLARHLSDDERQHLDRTIDATQ